MASTKAIFEMFTEQYDAAMKALAAPTEEEAQKILKEAEENKKEK